MKRLSLSAFQERMIARALRKGWITEEMAANRRTMVKQLRPFARFHVAIAILMLAVVVGLFSRLIGVWAMTPLILLECVYVLFMAFVLIKGISFCKTERHLRREAVLDARLTPRFPDRIWAWRQGRAIENASN